MPFCNLCPRNCFADRTKNIGFCGVNDKIKIAKADLHFWEEPCISGTNGSGTIFFSGCSLGCCFCQNSKLSHKSFGKEITDKRFYEILFELKNKSAHNINLVTADHFIPRISNILKDAKDNKLDIPVILNTSSYLKRETVQSLKNIVDIYIADFKFYNDSVSKKYAGVSDYAAYAKNAIDEMYSQVGECVYENNLLKKGLIVRVLVLPNNIIDAKLTIKYLLDKYSDKICLSIMSQFTPIDFHSDFPELSRTLTESEYKSIVDFAYSHGFRHGYIQECSSHNEKYIPDFDFKGV